MPGDTSARPSTTHQTPEERQRRRRRRGIIVGVAVVGVAALGVGGIVVAAPLLRSYGIYVVPPSPQQYAEFALDEMSHGLDATPDHYAEVRAETLAEVATATDYAGTYDALAKAATELGGPHTTFADPAKAAEMFGPSSGGNSQNQLPTVSSADGVTTIRLPTLIGGGTGSDSFGQKYIDTVVAAIGKAAPSTSAWVVDLRENHGGNVWPMLAAVAPLLDDGTVETFDSVDTSTIISVDGGAISSGGKEQSAASAPQPKVGGPVAVVVNGMTGSSAEAVAIAFIGQSNVRVFGQPSYGFSTANQPMRLYDGAVVNLTVAVDADRTGKRYGVPIEPDETIDDTQLTGAIETWLATVA
ncbi:S41 family peptidase [Agreia pratensis]|uniref:Peptidase family S41 n=1 Tax=Agreia pratensis TaxID=150121 RepID=A0A1X7J124_9MICO|nr:S41 family peptidase [Agreia pratensis]MBF4636125.1 S41 family peptidase [Agreia pratensis]SMG20822.1 Peptidase family S41 [Agreia pratensis]